MNYENFINYLKQPSSLLNDGVAESDIDELCEKYPYYTISKLLKLKIMSRKEDLIFEKELKRTSLYVPDRRNLYFFIHPEKLSTDPREKTNSGVGNYFEMVNKVSAESGVENGTNSLKELVERLKSARQSYQEDETERQNIENKVEESKEDIIVTMSAEEAIENENLAKKYIQNGEYKNAIVLLERLKNLNNPKKSIYFADQIKFLRKIIENQ